MTVLIEFAGPSGSTFSATLQRQSDSYYFNPAAPAWQAAPTYANKKNALTEGTNENRGSYSASISNLGNDGLVTVRIHNELVASGVAGIMDIFISGGIEVPIPTPLAQSETAYYADIRLDKGSTTDYYSVGWLKNSNPIITGITSPSIRVWKRTDGSDLIASGAMTQIGSIGSYKYDASGAELSSTGAAYEVEATAVIDGAARIWRKFVGRDS